LVHPLPFLIPLFGKDGVVNAAVAKAYTTALWLYDLTGGLRIGRRHRRIDKAEALRHLPNLRGDRLVAAFVYYDARTDDARLTLAIVRTAAVDYGAVASNHLGAVALTKDAAGHVTGAELSDGTVARARAVVNAAGVWADDVRALDEGTHPDSLRPAKGIHVTVPAGRLPCDIAAVLPVPKDHRSVFVIPWGDRTYIGTTDTDYDGSLDDPESTPHDVAYLLDAVNAATTSGLTAADVTGSWAGLRPLVKGAASARTADLSRRHQVTVRPSGLVTVTGGKLTTYRRMAADTVDAVVRVLGGRGPRSRTRHLPLRGAVGLEQLHGPDAATLMGVAPDLCAHLVDRYGAEAPRVVAMADGDPSWLEPLVPGLEYLRVEAVWAVRSEMGCTLDDVLARRTRALLRDRDAAALAAPAVAELMAPLLGWSPEATQAEIEGFTARAARERASVGA
jgi:glycerol-3-phosphate dehydrogenase